MKRFIIPALLILSLGIWGCQRPFTPVSPSFMTFTPTPNQTLVPTATSTSPVTLPTATYTSSVTTIQQNTYTATFTYTVAVTNTFTFTPTATYTPTFTFTTTYPVTQTATSSVTMTQPKTSTPTFTPTATYTPTSTFTATYPVTQTATSSVTTTQPKTSTPTFTPTATYTPTSTFTATYPVTLTTTATVSSSPCTNSFGYTCTPTPNLTLVQTATPTSTFTPTVVSNITPILTPIYTPSTSGIYVGAQFQKGYFWMLLSVNGAPENDPVTFGTVAAGGSTTIMNGSGIFGGTAEYYTASNCSVAYIAGADYFISATTSIGTASVTLTAPGVPVYSSTNTFTWSPESNSDYAIASQVGGSYSNYTTITYSADINSPYTFPAAAFPSTGYNYNLALVTHNQTNNVTGADSQSYFYISSAAYTQVSE